jgi:hypothetical protein
MSIIIIALSIAFCWVEFLNPFRFKPFNCVKCLTGWISLGFGVALYGWLGIVYLPLGVFIGSMFEGIKMRWL